MLEKVGALAEDGPRKLRVTRETGKDAVLGLGVWWSMGIVVYSQCVLLLFWMWGSPALLEVLFGGS